VSHLPRPLPRRAASVVLALLGVLACGAPALAQSLAVQVQMIYATNAETAGMDPSLAAFAQSFAQFRYSTYRRLGGQTLRLSGSGGMDLPGGRRLELVPKGAAGDAQDLKVAVYDNGRKLVVSDMRLVPGGQPVIVGGFKYQDGVLFLAIQAVR
jgi:hypothetical protein